MASSALLSETGTDMSGRPAPMTPLKDMVAYNTALQARRNSAPIDWAFLTDSIGEGWGADNIYTTWPAYFQALLDQKFPTTGVTSPGFIFRSAAHAFTFPAGQDPTITGSKSANTAWGLGRRAWAMGLTYASELTKTATSLSVRVVKKDTSGAFIVYSKVGTGAKVEIANVAAGSAAGVYEYSTPVGALASRTIYVQSTSNVVAYHEGMAEYYGTETSGNRVWSIGKSQTETAQFTKQGPNASNPAGVWIESVRKFGPQGKLPDVWVLAHLTNDASAYNRTPDQYYTYLLNLIDLIRSVSAAPIWIIAPQEKQPGQDPLTAPWEQYIIKQYAVAAIRANVAARPLSDFIPIRTTVTAADKMFDGVHPTSKAYREDYAPNTFNILFGATGGTAPSEDITRPVIASFSSPTPGAIVAGSTVNMVVTASDNVGVATMSFSAVNESGAVTFIDSGSPSGGNWALSKKEGDLPRDTVKLRAVARDAAGNVSDPVDVSVTMPAAVVGVAPTITLVSPAEDTVAGPDQVFEFDVVDGGTGVDSDAIAVFAGGQRIGKGELVSGNRYQVTATGPLPITTTNWYVVAGDNSTPKATRRSVERRITAAGAADTTPPVLTVQLPVAGTLVPADGVLTLRVTASDAGSGMQVAPEGRPVTALWGDVEIGDLTLVEGNVYEASIPATALPEGMVGTQSVRFRGRDVAGNTALTTARTVTIGVPTPGRTPPTAPVVTVTSVSATTVNLAWEPSTSSGGTIASYAVGIDSVYIGQQTARTYTATSLSPSTEYVFVIRAIDDLGVQSEATILRVSTIAAPIIVDPTPEPDPDPIPVDPTFKTTVILDFEAGGNEPAFGAWVDIQASKTFESGPTTVLPLPRPVMLGQDGLGPGKASVALTPTPADGSWNWFFRINATDRRGDWRAAVVPVSESPVYYSLLDKTPEPPKVPVLKLATRTSPVPEGTQFGQIVYIEDEDEIAFVSSLVGGS